MMSRSAIAALCALTPLFLGVAALAGPPAFNPIDLTEPGTIVTLTGHDLTIEEVIAVARRGAKVRYSPEAIQHAADGAALKAEAGAENMPVYGLNRGYGAQREVELKKSTENSLAEARNGAREGVLPEIADEDLIRAFLVIRANSVPFEVATPEFMQMLVDLLNKRVTPVMYSRGTLGEGDLFLTSNYTATMYGRGEAYFEGQRMSAADALAKAGLKPLAVAGGGGTTNAYGTALAALLVDEARGAMEWTDLVYAMDLLGMNSSVTPLSTIVQAKHPVPWIRWEAAKIRDIIKDSYLFEDDPSRILQDPEGLRAGYTRQGSAWQAWAALRDSVLLQMNSGEQNPAIVLDASPKDSWELATPWMMKYYVKGGPLSNGRHGYVVSNANWDPYPMTNEIEAFNLAFANMAVAVAQRIERFSDRGPTAFFTGIKPADVLSPEVAAKSPSMSEPYFNYLDAWKEMQTLTQSIVPDSNGTDFGVADIEANTRLKAARGRQAIDLHYQLLAYDLLTATYWLDVRQAQTPGRKYGAPATAAWQAFRQKLPWQMESDQRPDIPYGVTAYEFMKSTPAETFYKAGAMPAGMKLPVADSPGIGNAP
jgi:histidine ammonia-lyase